jgi:phenylacetate-CoA ligase
MSQTDGVTSKQVFDMLMDSRTWSFAQMLTFQQSQLEQLLRHARANVPFYRTRLDCMFRKGDSIDWHCWNEIPILTRQDVQENNADVVSQQLPAGHGITNTFRTSGSTGRPISVNVSTLMAMVNGAADRRFMALAGVPATATMAYTRDVFPDGTPVRGEWAYRNANAESESKSPLFISRKLAIARRLDLLAEHKVDVLLDFPTSVELLAQHNLSRKQPVRLSHVVGYGMGFTSANIALNQKSFGATTISAYACKEAGALAHQCPQSRNFHVNTELVFMEPDEAGRGVIVTPFFQAAQPFIRYRLDDDVQFLPACVCGHQHLTIRQISGKSDPVFHFPGGKSIVTFEPELSKTALYSWVMAAQIAQTGPASLEFRYVARADAPTQMQAELRDYALNTWHPELQFSFKRVEELPSNAGGKLQRFVQEWQTRSS